MAYPHVPYTFTDGLANDVNAARLNLLGTGIRDSQQGPAVRVFHNANISIADSTITALSFNSERYDQALGAASTQHDTVTNNSRLTALYAGIYLITGNVAWDDTANNGGTRQAYIRVNGATYIAADARAYGGANITRNNLSAHYSLAVNDYVELAVFQSSTLAKNVVAVGNYSPEFMMVRVA